MLQDNLEQLQMKNLEDQTPLDLALENMDEKMVEILAQKMQLDEEELKSMEECVESNRENIDENSADECDQDA